MAPLEGFNLHFTCWSAIFYIVFGKMSLQTHCLCLNWVIAIKIYLFIQLSTSVILDPVDNELPSKIILFSNSFSSDFFMKSDLAAEIGLDAQALRF